MLICATQHLIAHTSGTGATIRLPDLSSTMLVADIIYQEKSVWQDFHSPATDSLNFFLSRVAVIVGGALVFFAGVTIGSAG